MILDQGKKNTIKNIIETKLAKLEYDFEVR